MQGEGVAAEVDVLDVQHLKARLLHKPLRVKRRGLSLNPFQPFRAGVLAAFGVGI